MKKSNSNNALWWLLGLGIVGGAAALIISKLNKNRNQTYVINPSDMATDTDNNQTAQPTIKERAKELAKDATANATSRVIDNLFNRMFN